MLKKDRMRRGSIRTTSFDVAALAGVSQSVVSRAFRPGSSIAGETRDKVLEAARKLNYVPNSIASSLTTHRSNIVAIILGSVTNPFYAQVLDLFGRELQARNRQMMVLTLDDDMGTDDAIMRLLPYQVDGVILTSQHLSTRMVGMCHDRGIPVVLFNRYIPNTGAFGVRCDNEAGGGEIARAFLSAGARSFAVIAGGPAGSICGDRARGFTDHLIEAGVPRASIKVLDGGSSYDGGGEAVRRMVDEMAFRPDAVFATSDIMAMGALDTLRLRYGLSVPSEVMVAGFDDIPEVGRPAYRLTTIRQPVQSMVVKTLDLLNLDDPHSGIATGQDIPMRGELVWRDTLPETLRGAT